MLQALLPTLLGNVIDKILPDPQAAAEAKLRALEMAQKGDLAVLDADLRLALAQSEVNKVEAGTDVFRGGWRPATGWVCAAGLGYQILLRPLLPWLMTVIGVQAVPPLPPIDMETLLVLLGGLLGLGTLRTREKLAGGR